ncbi:MAG: TatD family hydrolase [Angelakisella sp.]
MYKGIFDSHAHYDDPRFDPDREEKLQELHRGGIEYIMNIGADIPTSCMTVKLAEQYGFIYGAVGIHPSAVDNLPADYLTTLEQLTASPKVKAIGEVGLDYHYEGYTEATQKRVFVEQLNLAKRLDLPVIIHSRDAHADTMDILQAHTPRGVVHCYSGSAEMAQQLVKLGLYIGFTGVVTFKNARRALEAVEAIPLERLVIETDCPYLAPEPYRGQRCDSLMLGGVIEKMAQVKGVTPEELIAHTTENAKKLYNIS